MKQLYGVLGSTSNVHFCGVMWQTKSDNVFNWCSSGFWYMKHLLSLSEQIYSPKICFEITCVAISFSYYCDTLHPPHSCPAKFGRVLLYFPCLFGKKLFSMQGKLVDNKQTHFLKQNFSETITPINKSCMLLFNLWINPVVCWYLFLMLMLIIV